MGIYDPLTDELRGVTCPAGDPIGDVIGATYANCPGVRCRCTHDSLNVADHAKILVRWCCHADGGTAPPGEGYVACPVWQYEKSRLEQGRKSLGDERERERADERQWRKDLTGSEYGDTSDLDVIEERVQAAIDVMHETGATGLFGSTGTDPADAE